MIFILFAYFANYLPGFLWGPGWGVRRLVAFLFMSIDGFYGMAMSVFVSILVPFLIFAAFVRATGIGNFFMDIAMSLAGWARGGPAKVAVFSSALFGMISGSAMANVASVGTFTIPMMKKTGFRPEMAAAVEASASTGGQAMPPIMGAAAFLMADYLGVPYWNVAKAAVIPAVLYYVFLWFSIDLLAIKCNAKGLPRNEIPVFWKVLQRDWFCIIPIVGLITALGVFFWRAEMCALLGIGLAIIVSFFRKETWLKPKKLVGVLEDSAVSTIAIGGLCAGLGIIIGLAGLTGLGINLSDALIKVCGGNLVMLLFTTAIVAIILGMGMPTAGVYLFCVLVLAPALIRSGIPAMAAHMFILYFGLVGLITPPVALAAYAAAPIAEADPFKTGWLAVKLSAPLYVVPFIFVQYTGLLLMGSFLDIVLACCVSIAMLISFYAVLYAFTLYRFIGLVQRILYLVATCLLFYPKTSLVGIMLCIALFLYDGRVSGFKLYRFEEKGFLKKE